MHFPPCPALLHRAAHGTDEFLSYTEKLAGWVAQLRRQMSHCSDKLTAASRAGTREGQQGATECTPPVGRGAAPPGSRQALGRCDSSGMHPRNWTGSSPAARTTARLPPSSLTASTSLSLVHEGLCSQDLIMSPAQTETHPPFPCRLHLGEAGPWQCPLQRKEGTCQRLE